MKSFKNKNECGSSWGRVWLAAWLAVAALLVGRSLWLPGAAPRQVASASPVADAELTRVSLEAPITKLTHAFQPIERLRVGMRVVSDNPETDTPEPTAVDPASWRLVKLYAEQRWPDGTLDTIHIETLQPPAWLELFQAKVGSQVPPPLDLVEMGLPEDLETTVVAIEPCPRLESGPGRVVLTTVNHLNNDVWELSAENALGAREKLRPTGSHKFYSETRRTWVSTKEIHDNEVIRGRAGPLTIVAREQLPGTQRVYNLTVEGEHVYYVSELGLLAHNMNCRPDGPNGTWKQVARSDGDSLTLQSLFSGQDIQYRNGKAYIKEFNLDGTNFDRFKGGVLGEVKGNFDFAARIGASTPKATQFVQDLVRQARSQVDIARKYGLELEWHVRKQDVNAFQNVLSEFTKDIRIVPYGPTF